MSTAPPAAPPWALPRAALAAFLLLVVATAGAFVVTARLKRSPPVLQAIDRTRLFSPNGDGRLDTARISFRLKATERVDVAVVDGDGETVRRLGSDRVVRAGRRAAFTWDGRTDDGEIAEDGRYRPRVTLRDEGRAVVLPQASVTLDTTPPAPVVTGVDGGEGRAQVFVPQRDRQVRIRLRTSPRRRAKVLLWRTDRPKAAVLRVLDAPAGQDEVVWDGTLGGRPAPPGTYMASVRTSDPAGNVGTSTLPRQGVRRVRGRPGITLRRVTGRRPSPDPVRAGDPFTVVVDAGGAAYRWSLRRLGRPRPERRGVSRRERLVLRVPADAASGVYLLALAVGPERYQVVVPVDDRARHSSLLVLPALSWQARNEVDADGDGLVDTLVREVPAPVRRPLAPPGLPEGFTEREAEVLAFLDRRRVGVDLTTDLALAGEDAAGPRLAGHRGLVLAGEPRWITPLLGERLRAFAEEGGRVLSFGTDALRRTAILEGGALRRPSGRRARDVFGARTAGLRDGGGEILAFAGDRIGLFSTTGGLLGRFDGLEPTTSAGGPVLAAAGPDERRPVVVATRVGEGLVIRTGLPGWPEALRDEVAVQEVTLRAWTLISR